MVLRNLNIVDSESCSSESKLSSTTRLFNFSAIWPIMKNSPLKSASFKISSIFSNANSDLCVFDMLRFWKYGLYAFLRFALFKERRLSRRREGFDTTFEGKERRE